ncbi:MAG: hypothetical protein EP348_10575 [Alphaproteobacteria bacterium]|nr:MAG: hypothetical protein EP348_10575 [Alphaproteobacteria bacterium]
MMDRYLPTPSPDPSLEGATFWNWCRKYELRFQKCGACGRHRHPPVPVCRFCGSDDVLWDRAPEGAELFSYTIIHNPVTEALKAYVPYNIAVVSFPDFGVRLISNIIDLPPEKIRIGMPLRLVWQESQDGTPLPLFSGK